jgi:hypothetical protein
MLTARGTETRRRRAAEFDIPKGVTTSDLIEVCGRKRNRPSKAAKAYKHRPCVETGYRLESDIAAYYERQGYSARY